MNSKVVIRESKLNTINKVSSQAVKQRHTNKIRHSKKLIWRHFEAQPKVTFPFTSKARDPGQRGA